MEELTVPELQILTIIVTDVLDKGKFSPGVKINPTVTDWLESVYSKFTKALDASR